MPKTKYNLNDLITQCEPKAPIPEELRYWDQVGSVGLEQIVMGDQVDIREAVFVFLERLADRFDPLQLILFGSRARGDYHEESDADGKEPKGMWLSRDSYVSDSRTRQLPDSPGNQ